MTEPERTGSDATMADTVAADKVAAAIAAAEHDEDAGRREDAASHFTERFASVLVEAGIPRMPARVFAALLAAVSGGVRYLVGVGMVRREGKPGSRRHHYRVPDNVWDEVISSRDRLMARWTAVLRDGIKLLGADTPAGARLADSVRYFEFVSAELPQVLARWRERNARE